MSDTKKADLSNCDNLREACRVAFLHYMREGPYPDLLRGQAFQHTVAEWIENNPDRLPAMQEDINAAIDAGCRSALDEVVDGRVQELIEVGMLARMDDGELRTTRLGSDLWRMGVI